jgi:hypothetical protein
MSILLTTAYRRNAAILVAVVVIFCSVTILQDLLAATFHHSSFYFSESFLFSSFWWLFIPISAGQFIFIKKATSKPAMSWIRLIVSSIFLHLFTFPALVLLMSSIFYNHTFAFIQTFQFSLSEYLYTLMFVYSLPFPAYHYLKSKKQFKQTICKAEVLKESLYLNNLIVSEGGKRKYISVDTISYVTASPPYISLHCMDKKYLYNESLKSLMTKIDTALFVRVHKSTIVNVKYVLSYTSRLNGDYDITLQNGNEIRVSRHYASQFKMVLEQSHQVTTK